MKCCGIRHTPTGALCARKARHEGDHRSSKDAPPVVTWPWPTPGAVGIRGMIDAAHAAREASDPGARAEALRVWRESRE